MFWPLRRQPRVLRRARRLRARRPDRLGTHMPRSRATTCCSCFAYALCFAGAWLLARELGAGRAGAAVAGAAFAYAPWRLEQEGHLHIISSGGIALALFCSCAATGAGPRRDDPRRLARRDVAVLARLLARPAARLPARRRDAGGASPSGGGAGARARRAACCSRPPPGCSASRSSPGCSRARTCASSTTTPRRERTIDNVAVVLRPAVRVPRRVRRTAASGAPPRRRCATRSNVVPEKTLFPGLAILAARARRLAHRHRCRAGCAAGSALGALGVRDPVARLSAQRRARGCIRTAGCMSSCRAGRASACPARLHTLTTLCLALLAAGGAQALAARARARRGARAAARRAPLLLVRRDARRGLGLRRPSDRAARAAGLSAPRRSRRCTCPTDGARQPPLRAVVDRRLPEASSTAAAASSRASSRPSCARRASFPDARSVALPAPARRAQRDRAPRPRAAARRWRGARQPGRCADWTSSASGADASVLFVLR